MKYQKLAVAITAFTANAYALDGTVVDENRNAITNALIKIEGSRQLLKVDDSGRFSFDHGDVHEIHVTAPGLATKSFTSMNWIKKIMS